MDTTEAIALIETVAGSLRTDAGQFTPQVHASGATGVATAPGATGIRSEVNVGGPVEGSVVGFQSTLNVTSEMTAQWNAHASEAVHAQLDGIADLLDEVLDELQGGDEPDVGTLERIVAALKDSAPGLVTGVVIWALAQIGIAVG